MSSFLLLLKIKIIKMEKAYMENGMLIVMEFHTPIHAHAYELSREFMDKWNELCDETITEAEWLAFWNSRKNVDVT
jgi:hypothetical protein